MECRCGMAHHRTQDSLIHTVRPDVQHTVAAMADEVITWGGNGEGQCGQGERAEPDFVKPRSLRALRGVAVTQIACGACHTLVVTAASQVGSTGIARHTKATLGALRSWCRQHLRTSCVRMMRCLRSKRLMLALQVYAWGNNAFGQLGLGDKRSRKTPTLVDGLWALPVAHLAAGAAHSAAVTAAGFLFTWGANSRGQLGLPAVAEVAAYHQVRFPAQVCHHRSCYLRARARDRIAI